VRRVLFLAYHFPPIGGAGVQRSVGFVRHLRELGYEPVVITGPGFEASRWTPVDRSLEGVVPPGTEVRRIPTQPPPSATGWRSRADRWLGLQEPFFRWWEEGLEAAAQHGPADLVYASMSPFESGAAAARIAARRGIPWVADLRDPWALDEMQVYASRLHRRLDRRRMSNLLRTAAAVVANTEEAAGLIAGLPGLGRTPVVAVPNGFDAADFAGPAPERADDAFRIVHAGYLHTELAGGRAGRLARRALGGTDPAVDIGTRSHVYLLHAVARLLQADPSLAGRIEVHLAGVLSERDLQAIADRSVVRTPGYLAHDETVRLLRSADLLFLPMHDLPAGRRATIVPGKTYEYLASRRPILAAVPDGDARDLLARAPTATLCRPADVDAMAAAIRDGLARRDRGEPVPVLPPRLLEHYERRALAQRLAGVYDLAIGEPASVSRAAEPRAASGSA
jgi:glycosyltransferase involved in cell wall biosynthesis